MGIRLPENRMIKDKTTGEGNANGLQGDSILRHLLPDQLSCQPSPLSCGSYRIRRNPKQCKRK